ncbi:mitochondrial import inner membrane translocase subunit TIM14 isoform X1 [Mus caroli]|uniref:Mitochondrial import inner membrane translocase subunit TIM14 n=1 Tax=Mus caroli TaxID=10089 RepID=A0A6P5PKZ3_MUSCR|nr:mitochondrial import inner membrane translocase subunit TIM14 isoform X1 [Mus caroli]
MASTVVAVGLTIAAAGFAGRYVLQAMKHVEPQVKQVFQSLPKSAFSGGYYRGGFEPKMTKREAALILGVSPTANKGKIRDAHRRIMLLNHPDKGKQLLLIYWTVNGIANSWCYECLCVSSFPVVDHIVVS